MKNRSKSLKKLLIIAAVIGFAPASFNLYAAKKVEQTSSGITITVQTSREKDAAELIDQWANDIDSVKKETSIQKKETSNTLLARLGIQDPAFKRYISTIKRTENPFYRLVPGRLVQARLTPAGKVIAVRIFRPMDVQSEEVAYFEIVSLGKSKFSHANKKTAFKSIPVGASASITSTLEESARSANIPLSVLAQVRTSLGEYFDVNKAVGEGDTYSIVYEKRELDGVDLGFGRLLAVEYRTKNKVYEAYWYGGEGLEGYYDSEGNRVEKTFMRFPCNSVVTSSFNRVRRHPITRRLRPHWGVDLAAPKGTPVYAAGDGVILHKRYQKRGYGYWLEIDHGSGYQSIYAHLSKYASGVEAGQKVKKGQLIGYVGRTGMATGPHLHYELKRNGEQINPLTAELKTDENINLKGNEDFKLAVAPLRKQIAMINKVQLAHNTEHQEGNPTN